MGKFRSCVVAFKQGQEVFREGDRVSGVVVVEVTEAVVVKGVRVYCYGESLTKWSKDFSRNWNTNQVSSEKYFAQSYHLFGKKFKEEGPNPTLTVGKHRWSFAFRLPASRLPSSFEGEYGAIRWFLKVEVDKPFPSINNKWYRPFTLLSHLDINDAVYQPAIKKEVSKTVSKALGIGNAGTLTLNAQTDHFGYCPGETIVVNAVARNESTKDMGRVSITLSQNVRYTANDETKTSAWDLVAFLTDSTLLKGTTMALTDIQLRIPSVPPTSRKRACHHIFCTYNVKVCVHVPWGLKLEADIPVAIGTVPRGYRLPKQLTARPQGAAAAAAGAAAAAAAAAKPGTPTASTDRPIPYRECEKGTYHFSKSYGNFPNLSFTPSTVFLPPTPHTPTPHPTPPLATPTPTSPSAPTAVPLPQQKVGTSGMMMTSRPEASDAEKGAHGGGAPALPAYTPLQGPQTETDRPPAYEDVVKMEEERETASAQTLAAMEVPEGRKCVTLLVRFPDSALPSFRQAIAQEQNNLLDNGQAFLAALSPQPLSTVEDFKEYWPDHYALALLVFPDEGSGEEWVRGVAEKGDNWFSHCDVLMSPSSWSVPSDTSERLVFSISVVKTKEGVSKEQVTAFSKKILPLFVKLRQKHGGIRQSVSKKARVLQGSWASGQHSVSVVWWPKARNYLSYYLQLLEGEYGQYQQEITSLFDTQPTLLISEDVTSLSTQPTAPQDDDVTVGDGDDDEEEENERVENLLDPGSQEEDSNSD